MTSLYTLSLIRIGWLVDAIESALAAQPDGAMIGREFLDAAATDRLPTADESAAALGALEYLGLLTRTGSRRRFIRRRFVETEGYRRGVREGLCASGNSDAGSVSLCVATPSGLSLKKTRSLQYEATDLRAAVFDVLASASKELLLASPFWDAETAREVGEMLIRRIEAGVRVDVLARFAGVDLGAAALREVLRERPQCRFFAWYDPLDADPFGHQTFHFKAAVADGGAKAYLGSANFTVAGLRSRMELGVILTGEPGHQLFRMLRVALAHARPVGPGEAFP